MSLTEKNHFLFQDYGPSGAYPSQSSFGPLPLTTAWVQTVLKEKVILFQKDKL